MSSMSPVLRMAHDISAQFPHLASHQCANAVADHIRRFWDPRMRAQLIAEVEAAGTDCDARVAAAARLLRADS